MSKTTIEWTGVTWNPTRGCVKISPGCRYCYAEAFANRFRGVVGNAYFDGFTPRLAPDALTHPFSWTKPSLVFVNSMSDLFFEQFPEEYLLRVARVMELTPWHTYQVLTKRHDHMRELLNGALRFAGELPNVWWGVSVENRRHGLPRVEQLRQTAARVRFLSVEPLLEDLGEFDLTGIDWVIVGGESGRTPRAFDPRWALSIRDACQAAGVKFFFKQHGGRNKKKAGRLLDGRTYDEMPARHAVDIPPLATRRKLRESFEAETGPVGLIQLDTRRAHAHAGGAT